MLDQNTDRMWYVIGAVIIGAALIFILNGTMPQLFASVGETFNKKSEDVGAIVDDIVPVGYVGENLLLGTYDDWTSHNGRFPYAGTFDIPSAYRSTDDMGVKPGDIITFSGEYSIPTGGYAPRLNFSPVPYDTDDDREISRVGSNMSGEGSFSYTVTIPENTKFIRVMPANARGYIAEEQSDTFRVRRLKLEKGSVATPWKVAIGE